MRAEVFADDEGGMAPFLAAATGVRLMVESDQLGTAQSLLAQMTENNSESPDFPSASEEFDPSSKSGDSCSTDHLLKRAWYGAIFSLIFIPVLPALWSLWILASKIFPLRHTLNRLQRRRALLTGLVDLTALVAAAAIISTL